MSSFSLGKAKGKEEIGTKLEYVAKRDEDGGSDEVEQFTGDEPGHPVHRVLYSSKKMNIWKSIQRMRRKEGEIH